MLLVEGLELLAFEVWQVVELEHLKDSLKCAIKQVLLNVAHLILFYLLGSEIALVGGQGKHFFVASFYGIQLSVYN